MMSEIYPSLFLLRLESSGEKTPFTYFLKRPDGNILFATKADISPFVDEVNGLGGVSHMLLGDRHHGVPATAALAKHFGVTLSASQIEATALRQHGVTVENIIPCKRHQFSHDLEIVPTPGHTRGALSYIWTNLGRKFLFVGDTIVPIDGGWTYWVSRPNRPEMARTVQTLAGITFDVILSNSFTATPVAWLDCDHEYRQTMFAKLGASLTG